MASSSRGPVLHSTANHRRFAYDLIKVVLRIRGEVMPPSIECPAASQIFFRRAHIVWLNHHLINENMSEYIEFTTDDEFDSFDLETLGTFLSEIRLDFALDTPTEHKERDIIYACGKMAYAAAYFGAKSPDNRAEYLKAAISRITYWLHQGSLNGFSFTAVQSNEA